MKTAECKSCGAPVIWAVTHKGKRMPVDSLPQEGGNIRLRHGEDGIVAEYPGKEHPSLFEAPRPRYVSHFSTCPDRDDWRKQA